MGQPFPPGPPPNNPAGPPGQGWGAAGGGPGWQPTPGWGPQRPSGTRSSTDMLAAVAVLVAAFLFLVRTIWWMIGLGHFFWSDVISFLSVIVAGAGGIVLLSGARPPTGRVIAAVGAGMIAAPSFGYLFNIIDVSDIDALLNHGAWLLIPAALAALAAIGALVFASASGPASAQPPGAGGWPQQPPPPPNVWPQPPMGGQPPAGFPGQQQPPPQWPQQ
ncbi:hypothetical protein [Nocardia blacklockiae]|uniref:hypothetical protein n=1 Tax=Nocardia blacklockiae TaxID=480036 RepID=UPI001892F174|nr:hypothetical protein [Nocardia blacklockiae]MBF6170791.1 hypothetical protein [Nocardia blacklockiae]